MIAKQLRSKSDYSSWLQKMEIEEPVVEDVKLDISKDNLYLGHSGLNYTVDNAVTVPLHIMVWEAGELRAKPRIGILVAKPGYGKSALASVIALDGIMYPYHMPTAVYDPAPNAEWYMHKQPITSIMSPEHARRAIGLMAKFNREPLGFNAVVYQPSFDTLGRGFQEEGTDKDYRLTLEDIRDMGYFSLSTAKSMLLDITGQSDNPAADALASEMLRKTELKNFTDAIRYFRKRETDENSGPQYGGAIRSGFPDYLQVNLDEGALADSHAPGQDMIGDMATHDFVVLRVKPKSRQDETITTVKNQVITSVSILRLLQERRRFISGNSVERSRALLTNPNGVQIVIDEIDKMIPRKGKSYTRIPITDTVLKERKNTINMLGMTQELSLVDPEFLKGVDYAIVGQLTEDEQEGGTADILRNKGISDGLIDSCKKLKYQKEGFVNTFGMRVNEWKYIDMHTRKGWSFYPALPRSALKIT
ncbi:MAG: hypothetical protein KGL39_57240 [Patescibacteria group bacterium]|nr:hypothetical protein [Patescibacteria group bacterium]